MNKKLSKLFYRGMWHRKKEVAGVCIATMLASFFITCILLFQENMYQWQVAENFMRFGSWFVMQSSGEPYNTLKDSIYLDEPVEAGVYGTIYNRNWDKARGCIGYMTPEFMEQANIELDKGRLPENENEIACDWTTLAKLGYNGQLGQEIVIKYYQNDNKSREDPERQAVYTLCGVFGDYSDVWEYGKYIPCGVITKEACEQLDSKESKVWLYSLKNTVRNKDYNSIYNELQDNITSKIFYNTSVYDFEAWGPKDIYNYIYILVMIIGVASLTYQVIGYQHGRNRFYKRIQLIGASKKQVHMMRLVENVTILVAAGVLGSFIAMFGARALCWYLEWYKGISFFKITAAIIFKCILTILIAIVMSELVNVSMIRKSSGVWTENSKKKSKSKVSYNYKGKLKKNNLTWQMQVRISRSSGLGQRLGVRIFSLGVTAVIIFCFLNISNAVKDYKSIENMYDMTGFQQSDRSLEYTLPMTTKYSLENYIDNSNMDTMKYLLQKQVPLITRDEYITKEQESNENAKNGIYTSVKSNEEVVRQLDITAHDIYCKPGNTSLLKGIDKSFLDKVEQLNGVESITYSCFESMRNWTWDSMDYEKMGARRFSKSSSNSKDKMTGYADKYLYTTYYFDADEVLYDRLKQYAGSGFDYDSFADGEKVIVFVDKNPYEQYDDSIKEGSKINFHYYNVLLPGADRKMSSSSYFNIFDRGKDDVEYNFFYDAAIEKHLEDKIYAYQLVTSERGRTYQSLLRTEYGASSEYLGLEYDMKYGTCVSPEAAGVVYVTDEIKNELKDIIPDFGYYTAVASKKLAETECEKQNELLEKIYGEELPEELKCELKDNTFTIKYNIAASYSATDNIVQIYCKSNDVIFTTNSELKSEYRTNVLNAFLEYGITMLAVIIINLLIITVLTKNRIENRTDKIVLLKRLGAGRSRIVRIFMIEVLRESLWCVFTLPLQMIIQFIVYRSQIKKI